ncbi:uncharacterized protein K452DRAFT_282179 [Aplosporella prunicola CBS 121167]|uniref:Uncharacterized protein n=1 Tax=Aplosporella prunicola CBS 121167 TaxID=1176127 RepID=A0A6A6BT78_9PEZI|nr:uncharacterized protein K452DRAFT_282179 [Aplosporella prunicola CBS 121167]KAF2147200.1 hypothetical protein K452DRAFT_282179 [Aplosporella prunicola CBS 121167]
MSAIGTWNSTSAASTLTRNSEKYGLDDKDTSSILVYKYRGSLGVSSKEELAKSLDKDPNLRLTRKRIPRGDSRVEVKREDLYNAAEKSEYAEYPNSKSGIASVCLPRIVWFKRLLFNQYEDLYIVSPETTPANSLNGSPESSQHCSPNNTLERAHVAAPHPHHTPVDD